MKNNYFIIFLCICLLVIIFQWINYLSMNNYIIECFQTGIQQEATSHSVDLPLTTKYSCKNFCGPMARCAITGQQCMADIDCPGCQPNSTYSSNKESASVPGNNSAGKLTWGVTPQYSPLTSGFGTREKVITKNMFEKPSMPSFGVDTWFSDFQKDTAIFDERYKPPSNIELMPNYEQRYSLTGQFIEDSPIASNSPL